MGHVERMLRVAIRRTVDGVREVGVLLIAFGPLDGVIARLEGQDAIAVQAVFRFFQYGIALLVSSVTMEWLLGFFPERRRKP